jgi:geranylgeranyl diphosphate synthase type II
MIQAALQVADPGHTQRPRSGAGFAGKLRAYRDLVIPTIEKSLPTGEPKRYLYEPIRSYLQPAGKGLRPALCIATCRAFGGDLEKALISAAALEILHTAFLVHDDVEDGSEYRRDQPTMQKRYGLALAVNAGDALQALGVRSLLGNLPILGPQATFQVLEEFDHLLIESLEGQAMELGWIRDNYCEVTEEDYLRMVLKKTCWYSFIHPCRIGAIVAGRNPSDLARFNRFGYFVGAAFQIQDDVLNLVGDARKYGKEIAGDLWEGKRTLVLSHVFRHASTEERETLRRIFAKAREERSRRDIEWLYDLLERHRSIDYARSAARELIAEAARAFEQAYQGAIEGEDKAFVREMVDYMVEREV